MKRLEKIKADQKRTAAFLRMEITPDVQWLISECERLTAENKEMRDALIAIHAHRNMPSFKGDLCQVLIAKASRGLASLKRGDG